MIIHFGDFIKTLPKQDEAIMYIGKGNVIIGISSSDMNLTDEDMLNMAKNIFDRYELIQAAKQ